MGNCVKVIMAYLYFVLWGVGMRKAAAFWVIALSLFLMMLTTAAYSITPSEYEDQCPRVDFSPVRSICQEYEPIYLCYEPLDFGPSEDGELCEVVALCATGNDFGPGPDECEDNAQGIGDGQE